MKVSHADVLHAEFCLQDIRGDYLRQRGWEHTSSTLGSFWGWTKEINGIKYVAPTTHAIRLQLASEPEGAQEIKKEDAEGTASDKPSTH